MTEDELINIENYLKKVFKTEGFCVKEGNRLMIPVRFI